MTARSVPPLSRKLYSAEERIRQIQWSAFDWLAGHELLGEAYWDRGARWCIGRPDTIIHRCEIIAGIGGSLVVHGDFDTCRFASYGDRSDAWSRLRWMADCTDVDYYVRQKASIGLGRVGDVVEYDDRVAEHELRNTLHDYIREASEPDLSYIDVFIGAIDHVAEEADLRSFLSEHDNGWDLWEYHFGRVLRPHVIISHVALNKCAWLLRERYGALGPGTIARSNHEQA